MPGPDQRLDRVESVYGFWGRFPLLYAAQDYVTFLGRPGTIRAAAVEALGVSKGARVLELACGTGRNFAHLERAIGPEGALVGFDYSREMLASAAALCRRRDFRNVALVQGDAALLPVARSGFDGVLSVLGVSAIPGWERALRRCREVMRPGGRIAVCDARLFEGGLRVLNPLVRSLYTNLAAWDPSKDIPRKMEEIFGNVRVRHFNAGTFFVAVSAAAEG